MNGRNRKSDIVVDLTSLLDVIFIVLLIVMCRQAFLSESASEKAVEAEARIEAAEQARAEAEQAEALYLQHAEKYENVDSYVLFIDVSAKIPDENDVKDRSIIVLQGGADTMETAEKLDITVSNSKEQFERLEDFLRNTISGYAEAETNTRPVVISLNREDDLILYRDELAIQAIFEELKADYPYVYFAE